MNSCTEEAIECPCGRGKAALIVEEERRYTILCDDCQDDVEVSR